MKCIEEEIPFELPEGWSWERLGNVSNIARGGSPRPIDAYITDSEDGINWIKIGDAEKGGKYIFSTKEKIIPGGKHKSRYVRSGNFLLTNSMSFGHPYILKTDGCIHDGWLVIGDIDSVFNQDYLYYALSSDFIYKRLSLLAAGSTVKNLKSDTVKKLLFPIPPMNEQRKIAENANNIINFIDLISSEKDSLFNAVSDIRSRILDLAIRGKLVPQDPNDEPASVLLDRIRAEKEELIQQGKIKRDKKESVIFRGEDNSYYRQTSSLIESLADWELDDIPDNWSLCCLGELCDYGNCINVDAKNICDDAWILDLEDIEKDTGVILQKIKKSERNSSSTKHFFHKGQVLYSKLRPYLNKVVIADEDGYCTAEILPLVFSNEVLPQYALYYLMSPTFLKYANRCSYGVKMPRLGTIDGKKAAFPLPPIGEQRRIVNTISELFIQIANIQKAIS
ncbi:MAG: restriction endonuclease subunit S [Firmicutes bacterium]|nr:restriction endonuclease subunit S [Bacillota bacterium]